LFLPAVTVDKIFYSISKLRGDHGSELQFSIHLR